MTPAIWNLVSAIVAAEINAPVWLRELARRSHEEILRLPKLEDTGEGQIARPVIEEKIVAKDYLDFLREQITLNARGERWTELLQKRLEALEPFIGKTVITAHFYKKPDPVIFTIDPITGNLLNMEVF